MQEHTGGFGGLSLSQIAEADRIRAEQDAARDARVKRRNGHKGSRVWGYQTAGSGKRGKKRD